MSIKIMEIKSNNILKKISLFFESKYFLAFISLITVLNFSINAGLWTYIEAGIILILMMISKSKFIYVPSIFIFIIGGGLTSMPNYKSFSFVFTCIIGFFLIVVLVYDIIKKRKELVCISFSNSFIITTLLLAVVILLSAITSVKPSTTMGALGGFLINIIVMYYIILSVKPDDLSKHKLADSFIIIFYVIFSMIIIKLIRVLQDNSFKDIIFNKEFFRLGWGHPNHYCSILSICSIIGIYQFISTFKFSNIAKKILYIFPLLGTIASCIFLSARGPLVGLMFALGAIFILTILKYRNNKKILLSSICLAIISAVCAALLYVFVIHDAFGGKGLNGRQEIWPVAWNHFKNNWFLGTGYGTQRIFIMAETTQTVYNYHNYFLQISTCGIVGIITFIVYLFNIGWHCINKLDWFNIAFISILALFLVNGFVDTLFFSNKIMPLFSICLCYVDLKPKEISLEKQWKEKLNIFH